MKPGMIDESKIIKKKPTNSETTSQVDVADEINQVSTINNEITDSQKKVNTNDIVQTPPKFVYSRDPLTKQVVSQNTINNTNIGIPNDMDIPMDHLKMMYVNATKYVEELMFDIKITKLLISNSNNIYYKNKYDYLNNELEFATYKLEVLTKLVKG